MTTCTQASAISKFSTAAPELTTTLEEDWTKVHNTRRLISSTNNKTWALGITREATKPWENNLNPVSSPFCSYVTHLFPFHLPHPAHPPSILRGFHGHTDPRQQQLQMVRAFSGLWLRPQPSTAAQERLTMRKRRNVENLGNKWLRVRILPRWNIPI